LTGALLEELKALEELIGMLLEEFSSEALDELSGGMMRELLE